MTVDNSPLLVGSAGEQARLPAEWVKTNGMPYDNRAQITLVVAVKLCISASPMAMVDIAWYPRRLKSVTQKTMLELLGEISLQFTKVQGHPPLFLACDAASTHRLLTLTMIGSVHPSQLQGYTFWNEVGGGTVQDI
jgi:hypothetical protein